MIKNFLVISPNIKIKQIQYLLLDTSICSKSEIQILYDELSRLEQLLYDYQKVFAKDQQILEQEYKKILDLIFDLKPKMHSKLILEKLKDYIDDEKQKQVYQGICAELEKLQNLQKVDMVQLKNELQFLNNFLKKKVGQQLVLNQIVSMVNLVVQHKNKTLTEDEIMEQFTKYMQVAEKIKTYDAKIFKLSKEIIEQGDVELITENFQRQKIKTLFKTFDEITGGLEKKRCVLILGKTGFGKSAFCINLAVNFLKQGYNVLFITLENTLEETKERIFQSITKIPISILRSGITPKQFQEKLRQFYEENKTDGVCWIEYFPADTLTVELLKTKILMRPKVDIVIIDYLDLLKYQGKQDSERMRVMYITRELKKLQQETDTLIISPSQIHREAYTKKKLELDNVQESFAKVQEADAVLILEQSLEELKERQIRLHIAKMRHSKQGDRIKMKVDFETFTFEDLQKIVDVQELESNNQDFEVEQELESSDEEDINGFIYDLFEYHNKKQ